MSAMDETGSPWPGMVFRTTGNYEDEFGANVTTSVKFSKRYKFENFSKVTIKRKSGILYISFDDGADTQVLDMTSLNKTFNAPVTFGSSLDGSGNPQRYFKGTLKNMQVIVFE